ncbi:GDSL-type esterase/lipase family protein [Leptolyngbya sp. CCNP1308]|uniref:GDSL-type esterase/lipase family protein n=1 Tax=Leptolyngbya sp. CCNP1308 TaxID=3110255 RepID=UPI002B1FF326|nr:GDSL-type esterase/lipase family protein [Leptolyngbya sp. CCNP1308]MEA5449337.1 GDSL-type esterase/lipase family protein [Leptolyngbya sp. CCNP1308]
MVEIVLWALGIGIGAIAIVELLLRVRYGLGNPPLYVADTRTGYRLAPNQSLRRRGHRIEINQYSMRGPAVDPQRPTDALRVLMVGDSIVNGGWWTDQSQLLSVKVQKELANLHPSGVQTVEVLNASANSWGPRNELGYLLRFGTFEAQLVLVVLNTDDLFAIAPNSYELGRNPAYPTRRPPLALWEVAQRRLGNSPSPALQALHDQGGDRVGVNLEALRQLNQVVLAAGGRLAIAMTPLRRELDPDGPRDYELVARHRLTAFAQSENIPYLDGLPLFQQTAHERLYFDHIHLSPEGNDWVSQALAKLLIEIWNRPSESSPPSTSEPLSDLW